MSFRGGATLTVALNGQGSQVVARRASMAAEEMAYVRERRSRFRASWQDCARMINRPVHDVRLACDPDYDEGDGPAPAAPRAVRRPSLEVGGRPAMVLRALADIHAKQAAAGKARMAILASEVRQVLDLKSNVIGHILCLLKDDGMVEWSGLSSGMATWVLTPKGDRELLAQDAAHG